MSARVAFNALSLQTQGSGVHNYIRELLAAMPTAVDARLSAVVQRGMRDQLPPEIRPRLRADCAGWRRGLESMRPVGDVELFHALDVDVPIAQRSPVVVTVHDMAVFDVPSAFSARKARIERLLLHRAARRADAIVTVSAFTAERLKAITGHESCVIWEAPGSAMQPAGEEARRTAQARWSLPDRFVLQLGTIDARKRTDALATACREVGIPLVLAGGRFANAVVPSSAIALGRVPAETIPALYGAAHVVAYISDYEGFGLPPLEAMACGAVVLASAVGAIPETTAGGAVLVPLDDPDALVKRLRDAVEDTDLRQHLRTRGRARASELTWAAAADRTADVYRGLGVIP